MMQNLNLKLFYLINAGPHLHSWQLVLPFLIAKYLIFLIPIAMVLAWIWGPGKYRSTLLLAVLAVILTVVINKIIGHFWFQPRPFMAHLGNTYLHHRPNASFPSDHAAIIWAIGLTFLGQAGLRTYGVVLLILALLVGWARVFLGVHFPLDILGGIVVATFAVVVLELIRPLIDTKLFPWVLGIYRKIFKE